MVFLWFVSSFSRPDRKVILDTDIGQCSVDQITDDINALISMGLEHDASTASVIVPSEDNPSSIVSVAFDFPLDCSWKAFCRDFLKENCSSHDNDLESANEEN